MREDRVLQTLELGPRPNAQLGVERTCRVAIRGERVTLAPRPVEREHVLGSQPLAQRLGSDELLELRRQLAVAAEPQIGLDAVLERCDAPLLEAGRLDRRERLVRDVGKRRASPFLQSGAEARGCTLRLSGVERGATLLAALLEPVKVELLGLEPERVAGCATDEPVAGGGAERTPEPRH